MVVAGTRADGYVAIIEEISLDRRNELIVVCLFLAKVNEVVGSSNLCEICSTLWWHSLVLDLN